MIVPQVEPDVINGRFKGLVNSAVMLQEDGKVSLGQLTFQQFGPKEPKVTCNSLLSADPAL